MDYVFAVVVATSPWVFGFSHEPAAPQIAMACGIITGNVQPPDKLRDGVGAADSIRRASLLRLRRGDRSRGIFLAFQDARRRGGVFTILGIIGILAAVMAPRPRASGSLAH
jgi:hypothetical protein